MSTKRRRYLVDLRFQLKWTLIITLAGGLTATVFSGLLWRSLSEQNALLAEALRTDDTLRKRSADILVLLLNMPHTTAAERAKYEQRFGALQGEHRRSQQAKHALRAHNRHARYWVVGAVVLITAALFVWGVLLTHRVAGPLYVIRGHFRAFLEGQPIQRRPLRKGDELQELYAAVCAALERRDASGPRKE
jgi:hypothetical protein